MRYCWSLYSFMVAIIMNIGVSSCTDDKESNKDNEFSLIVGTWNEPYNEWTNVLKLSPKGNFEFFIHGNSNSGNGNYKYDEANRTLTLSYTSQQMSKTYIVLSLTKDQLVLTDDNINTHSFVRDSGEDANKEDISTEVHSVSPLEMRLFDTSWKLKTNTFIYEDGYQRAENSDIGSIVTFSSKHAIYEGKTYNDAYCLYLNGYYMGWWYEHQTVDGLTGKIWMWFFNSSSQNEEIRYAKSFGRGGLVTTLSSSTLKLRIDYDGYYQLIEYSATSTPSLRN